MGGVVHFEIPADDEGRARDFYRSVFGWSFQVLPEMEYSLAKTTPLDSQGRPAETGSINGGIFRRGDLLQAPVVTIAVDDIDGVLEQIGRLGGETVRRRMEVPGSGWNAYFRDSEGNVIGLWQNAVTPAQGASADTVTPEATLIHCSEQPTAVLREKVAMNALPEFFSRAFAAVAAETRRQNVQLAGPPFALYLGMPAETVDVEAGFPITDTLADAGTVVASMLPETEAYEAMHTGPYDTLESTYTVVQDQIKSAGKRPSDTMWEYYLNGPPTERDPQKWQTRVVWPAA
ncbi:GyrI-like domain-containing protein [Arthrobacter sp. SRS-W-1-2016]|uniref:GyrI-like domain-containing protein n=1 Tax=Arthrobacter sp. SRS-W-1-2016 TaxID=1930254 RepID=UPI0026849F36